MQILLDIGDEFLRAAPTELVLALRARLDGETVGMANIYLFHHPAVVFLGLLAIDPAYRDHQIGGQVIDLSHELSGRTTKDFDLTAAPWARHKLLRIDINHAGLYPCRGFLKSV